MRILLTADPELPVPPLHYGGIERVVAGLARKLRQLGCEVGLVAHADSNCQVEAFFPWASVCSRGFRDVIANEKVLHAAARSFSPHLVHSFSRLAFLLSLLPGKLPKIMSFQREPSRRTTAWASRLSLGSLFFTGCSEYICERGRLGGGKWTAIPNFVELASYNAMLAVDSDAPLVFLSRVEFIKGTHAAIAIARGSNRRLVIAGNNITDGEAGRYWQEEIKPWLGRDGIDYIGPVDDVQKNKLLGSAAAIVVPIEWNEPFGIVFAEALACATPVISCARGALPEIIDHGIHGFLINGIAEGIDAVARLGEIDRAACRARAEALFSDDIAARQYLELYRRVISLPKRPAFSLL